MEADAVKNANLDFPPVGLTADLKWWNSGGFVAAPIAILTAICLASISLSPPVSRSKSFILFIIIIKLKIDSTMRL